MASNLANRAVTDRTIKLWRLTSSFLRSFSTASENPTAASAASPSSSASKKPKRKKKKNLFEVAQFLPNWGLGYQMAKTHWVGVSYQITKINLYKDGRHGKAWGIVHKEGLPAADAPKKISGVHKRGWRYIPNSKSPESVPSVTKPTESAPAAEVQAA
ncbi:unnamed protein product [Prunus armeniaca]|uniref:Mitochondrial 28S ribosomal protein S34 n=1 Tax=Prunus armeniaca TaxID=36596 RepID=A0A6J5XJU9_PRUAR|nr:hypothetical protein GBA52_021316 [Prunus armeniaca]CAB4282343.1 unnamed protein product [Prunus armeniaca]CAB4312753.1 unnamed protein product [Prunus armeniaca]